MSEELSPEDREQLEDLFERAAGLLPAEQATFLDAECGAHDPLRAKLEWLLAGLAAEDRLGGAELVLPSRIGTEGHPLWVSNSGESRRAGGAREVRSTFAGRLGSVPSGA